LRIKLLRGVIANTASFEVLSVTFTWISFFCILSASQNRQDIVTKISFGIAGFTERSFGGIALRRSAAPIKKRTETVDPSSTPFVTPGTTDEKSAL